MATTGRRSGKRSRGRGTGPKSQLVRLVGGGTRWSRDRMDGAGGMVAERRRREHGGASATSPTTKKKLGGADGGTPFSRMSDEQRMGRRAKNAMRKARGEQRRSDRRARAAEVDAIARARTDEQRLALARERFGDLTVKA